MSLNPLNRSYNPSGYEQHIPYDQKELDRRICKCFNESLTSMIPWDYTQEEIATQIDLCGLRLGGARFFTSPLHVSLAEIYDREKAKYLDEISRESSEGPAPKKRRTVIGQKFTVEDDELLVRIYDRVKDDPDARTPPQVYNTFLQEIKQSGRTVQYTCNQINNKLCQLRPGHQKKLEKRLASPSKFDPGHFKILQEVYLEQKKRLKAPSPVYIESLFNNRLSDLGIDLRYTYAQIYRYVFHWNKHPEVLEQEAPVSNNE